MNKKTTIQNKPADLFNRRRPLLLLALALALLLVTTSAHATPPIEGNTVEFTDSGQNLGSASSNTATLGDLDDDGDLDAFLANSGANEVWLNDGSGTFSDSGQSLGSSSSIVTALGDLDGDGDLDAFVTNYSGQPDKVWLNNGNGTFTDSGQSLGSSNGYDVALGDLDGDGDLDALVANSNQVNTVWMNNGSGSFMDSGQSLGGTAISWGVALGDVDKDGDLDAFVANRSSDNKLWINDGSGTFSDSGQSLGGSTNSFDVALGDVDGDGDLDAYVVNPGSNQIWVNNGSGAFSDSGQSVSSFNTGITLGDLDGDGDLDAFTASNGPSPANQVWQNNGSGTFSDSGLSLGSSFSMGVALGDVDKDGDLDAFVANGSNQPNKVWRNDAVHRNVLYADSGQRLGAGISADVALGDVDGDGDLDAFVTNYNTGPANTVWLNNGGIFSDSGQSLGSSNSYAVALGDLDGDGDLDAFVGNFNQSDVVWINQGGAQAGTPGVFLENGQSLAVFLSTDIDLGDVDGDGDLDVYVAAGTVNKVWVNQGGAQAGTPGTFSDSGQSLGSAYSVGVALGDVDGDGDLDAYIANYGAANKVWINQGGAQAGTPGVFSDSGQSLGSANSQSVALGDVDGDGDLDAFVANDTQGEIVWVNQGGAQAGTPGVFSDSGQSLGSARSRSVALGDIDNDGDLDAFVAANNDDDKLWLNDGSGNFTDNGQTLNLGYFLSSGMDMGDVDADGDLDTFVVNAFNQPGFVWRNESGSAGFAVTDTSVSSPVFIPNSTEDDVMKVIFTHNGIAADRSLELARFDLDFFQGDCSTPLSDAEADAFLDEVRIRLDDGDDTFETDGSDVLVASISSFSMTGTVQQIAFTNDDANAQVTGTNSKTYWISALATATASSVQPNNFCLNFDPDADALVEGKTPDFSVSIQDSAATNTGDTPTAVTLQTISASTNNNFILVLAMIMVGMGTAAIALLIRRKQA